MLCKVLLYKAYSLKVIDEISMLRDDDITWSKI